ncbi:COX15/CtaA family protein [Cyanobium sp. Morenito 9A2]|uniref:COX15/CtaA family protein n=1 Tax=Cyanobium sp. Morenito 9A2 TaxID=2823718 RepID=UPI0020CC4891|nr:COX15/CtaA family protein [Cyanobium sp. Morenito 9A2]
MSAVSKRHGPQRRSLLLTAHLVVALVALVGIGGATRVMEAGLACPDWPLCYGSFFPGRQLTLPVFLEWFHRLDAFLVGVALLVLFVFSLWRRRELPGALPWGAGLALLLVAAQGGLGALTVLQLLPAGIVTAHLAVALVLVALVSGLHQLIELSALSPTAQGTQAVGAPPWWPPLAALTTLLVLAQCLLGGAMASQWAAGRCLASGEACGWLLAHRQGAPLAAGAVLLLAAVTALVSPWAGRPRGLALTAAMLVALQIALGVWSLRLTLAVPLVTVAHQLTAAFLVAVLAALTVRGGLHPMAPAHASVPAGLEVSRG